jgi:hypothetical protein
MTILSQERSLETLVYLSAALPDLVMLSGAAKLNLFGHP